MRAEVVQDSEFSVHADASDLTVVATADGEVTLEGTIRVTIRSS